MSPGPGSIALSKFQQADGGRVKRKLLKKAENEKAWRDCCVKVDARDEKKCRVCGRRGNPESDSLLDKIHRHHMVANDRRCGIHEPSRVISLCCRCNGEVHTEGTLSLEGDANLRSAETGRLCGVRASRFGEGGWRLVKVC